MFKLKNSLTKRLLLLGLVSSFPVGSAQAQTQPQLSSSLYDEVYGEIERKGAQEQFQAIQGAYLDQNPEKYRRLVLRFFHHYTFKYKTEIAGGFTVVGAYSVDSSIADDIRTLATLVSTGQPDGLEPVALFLLDAAAGVRLTADQQTQISSSVALMQTAFGLNTPEDRLTDSPYYVPVGRHTSNVVSEMRPDILLHTVQNALEQVSDLFGQGGDLFGFDMSQWMQDSDMKSGACNLMDSTKDDFPGGSGGSGSASASSFGQELWNQHSSMKDSQSSFCDSENSDTSLGGYMAAASLTACMNASSDSANTALFEGPMMDVANCVQNTLSQGASCPICSNGAGDALDWILRMKDVAEFVDWLGTSQSDLDRADDVLTRSELGNQSFVELHATNKDVHEDMEANEGAIEDQNDIINDPNASDTDKDTARQTKTELVKEKVKLETQDRALAREYKERGINRQTYEEYKEARRNDGTIHPQLADEDDDAQDTTEGTDTTTSAQLGGEPGNSCIAGRWYVPDSDRLSGPLDGVDCTQAQCDETEVVDPSSVGGMDGLIACATQVAQSVFENPQQCANVAQCPNPSDCDANCNMPVEPEGVDLASQMFEGACGTWRCEAGEEPIMGVLGCSCQTIGGGAGPGGSFPGCNDPSVAGGLTLGSGSHVGCPRHANGRSLSLALGDSVEVHNTACQTGITTFESYAVGPAFRTDVDTFKMAVEAPCNIQ